MFGYGLLGAGWLVLKTEGELQAWARRHGRWCLIGVIVAIGVVSLWTPFVHDDIAPRWFSWPNLLLLSPVPIITALLAWVEWRALNNDSEILPFAGAIGLFVLAYIGIAISLWPTSFRIVSVCGKPLPPKAHRPSCWSARCFCCRSSSCTPDGLIGCFAKSARRYWLPLESPEIRSAKTRSLLCRKIRQDPEIFRHVHEIFGPRWPLFAGGTVKSFGRNMRSANVYRSSDFMKALRASFKTSGSRQHFVMMHWLSVPKHSTRAKSGSDIRIHHQAECLQVS